MKNANFLSDRNQIFFDIFKTMSDPNLAPNCGTLPNLNELSISYGKSSQW